LPCTGTGYATSSTPRLLVEELNWFLRGWRQYYRYGNASRSFAKLDRYTTERMALLLSKRHGRRGRGYGMKLIINSGNRIGKISDGQQLCAWRTVPPCGTRACACEHAGAVGDLVGQCAGRARSSRTMRSCW
jgi:hypothetical protein